MRARLRMIGAAIAIACLSSLAAAAPPSPAGVGAWYQRVIRVKTIARRVLASNRAACAVQRDDFGFTAMSPDPDAPAAIQAAWIEGLGLGDGSTVVAVFESGPAAAAGLLVGDAILQINGTKWSPTVEGRQAFVRAGAGSHALDLVVRRPTGEVRITIPAQQICAADVWLTVRDKVNASANGTNIVVEGGLERLLASDDELAWVIAHEAAHVFLKHSGADRKADLANGDRRSQMERAADVLGVRLMLRAGFAPEASSGANAKIAHAARGPIARLLDLHGPYMAPRERSAFLMSEAEAARAEIVADSAAR